MRTLSVMSAAVLACAAGHALAVDPAIVDGKITNPAEAAAYGAALWTNSIPTSFGDNAAGMGGTPGDPENVTTGMEIRIPWAIIGNPAGAFKVTAILANGSHSFFSNQMVATGLPANTGNLGNPRAVNFQTLGGTQTLTLNRATMTALTPVLDGVLDGTLAAPAYGVRVFTQTNYTAFGNSTTTPGQFATANGSEVDGLYVCKDADYLYMLFTGNFWDFNKLSIFVDSIAGGQNRLLAGNPTSHGDLGNMSDDGSGNGLTFETNFEADYYLTFGGGNANYDAYCDYSELFTVPGAGEINFYLGPASHNNTTPATGVPSGGNAPGAPHSDIRYAVDNRNNIGVGGAPTNIVTPHRDVSFGSELDGVYAYVSGRYPNGRLNVLFTGNIQTQANRFVGFIDCNADSDAEGQNQLIGNNVDIVFNGLNRMGNGGNGAPGAGTGLKFDTGFAADYWMSFDNFDISNTQQFLNLAVLRANGPLSDANGIIDYGAFDGGVKTANDPIDFSGPRFDIQDGSGANGGFVFCNYGPRSSNFSQPTAPANGLVLATVDNSNVAGVTGVGGSGAGVTTGLELSIQLRELGWDGVSPIRITGMIVGGGHDYLSNQYVGTTDPVEPGEVTLVDFSGVAFPGNQYVEVVGPCPADFDDGSSTGTLDGGVDISDLLYYLFLFDLGSLEADLDNGSGLGVHDEGVDISDLLFYLGRFEGGC